MDIFLPFLANHAQIRRFLSRYQPIGGYYEDRGGVNVPVNHSQKAGGRITERAGGASQPGRNDIYPSASNINWGTTF